MRRPAPAAALGLAAVLLVILVVAGCSKKSGPTGVVPPVAPVGPAADTPLHAFERLRWAYLNRSTDAYPTLFTSDFTFTFAGADPARIAYGDSAWTRAQELLYAEHLFVTGTATEDAVNSIEFYYESPLLLQDDPRPGKAARWHQKLSVMVGVDLHYDHTVHEVAGATYFYMVRGDSARIPAGLGVGPDSTRWYVERWDDGTWYPGTHPSTVFSWGAIRARYR